MSATFFSLDRRTFLKSLPGAAIGAVVLNTSGCQRKDGLLAVTEAEKNSPQICQQRLEQLKKLSEDPRFTGLRTTMDGWSNAGNGLPRSRQLWEAKGQQVISNRQGYLDAIEDALKALNEFNPNKRNDTPIYYCSNELVGNLTNLQGFLNSSLEYDYSNWKEEGRTGHTFMSWVNNSLGVLDSHLNTGKQELARLLMPPAQ